MHAIKGSWVGQTFALAKCNDGGGKKSRIRRSKEERKDMVESFIKKYQKSNNGTFPSLNLTHKEVGGSFYTVREIVREIIQENRVLGPAKLTPEEQNLDMFLEHYPLGSIATQPEAPLTLSNETCAITHILPNIHQVVDEELVLNSSPENKRFDNGKSINGSVQAVEENEEFDAVINIESAERERTKVEKNIIEVGDSKTELTHMPADVVVETFPIRSVSKIIYDVDEKSSEAGELIGSLEEKETKKLELEAGNNNSVLDITNSRVKDLSVLVDEKVEGPGSPSLEKICELMVADPSLEYSNGSATKEEILLDVGVGDLLLESTNGSSTQEGTVLDNNGGGLQVNNVSPAEIKPINAPNGVPCKNPRGTDLNSSSGQPISVEKVPAKNNPEIENGGNVSQEASNPTLDRINLESWEGTSEKSAEPEKNPFLALVKGFIAAFVKFWNEIE